MKRIQIKMRYRFFCFKSQRVFAAAGVGGGGGGYSRSSGGGVGFVPSADL